MVRKGKNRLRAKVLRRARKCQDTSVLWLSVFGAALALALLGLSKRAHASSTAASVPAAKSGPQIEADCGLACRYHRANDNITFQALYLVNKVQVVEREMRSDDPDENKVRAALGPFCSANAAIEDCVKTYKSFQAVALMRLRQAMGKNEDVLARLTHGRQTDGSVTGEFTGIAREKSGEPYTPDVPTLKELHREFERLKASGKVPKQYSPSDLKNWAQTLVIPNPKATLIEFNPQPVDGNPHTTRDGEGFKLSMKREGPGGADVPSKADEKAYLRHQAELAKVAGGTVNPQDPKVGLLTPKQVLGDGKGVRSQDEISYEAFSRTRNLILGKVDESMKKDTVRKPAKTDKKPAKTGKNGKKDDSDKKPAEKMTEKEPDRAIDSEKAVAVEQKAPVYKNYDDDAKIQRPPGSTNSRYIRYDLNQLMKDIEGI